MRVTHSEPVPGGRDYTTERDDPLEVESSEDLQGVEHVATVSLRFGKTVPVETPRGTVFVKVEAALTLPCRVEDVDHVFAEASRKCRAKVAAEFARGKKKGS